MYPSAAKADGDTKDELHQPQVKTENITTLLAQPKQRTIKDEVNQTQPLKNITNTSSLPSTSTVKPLAPSLHPAPIPPIEKVRDPNEAIFRVVWNDGAPDHLIALTGAKNIFAAQLPKMPKEYIARLIFNREHRTMCIITPNGVIGGICFRPFYEQKFAEIVFCAIKSSEQVKGYGTRIMNHLKEHVKTEGVEFFLTYADNYATGYFKKQGFSKSLTMHNDRWRGYVKDYDGGTLMECHISKPINYLNVRETIKQQRESVYQRIQQISKTHVLYPGLTFPPPGSENTTSSTSTIIPGTLSSNKRTYWDISQIPGVLEAGWVPALKKARPAHTLSPEEHEQLHLNARLTAVLKSILEVKDSWPFKKAVDKNLVKDYYEVIKEPMDLSLMGHRLNNGHYKTKELFEYDVHLVIKNCKSYNASSTTYYRCASVLEKEFLALMDRHFNNNSSMPS